MAASMAGCGAADNSTEQTSADDAFMMNRKGEIFYGRAEEILTEKNISRSFDVDVIVDEVSYRDKNIRSIIPVALVNNAG